LKYLLFWTETLDSNSVSGIALEYVCQPHEGKTNACTVSFRINVLSTQHSNSLFVIKFNFGNLEILSEPIRSVSKPEQIRKKLALCEPSEVQSEKTTKKRARAEELLETLTIIQNTQLQHTELISSLIYKSHQVPANPVSIPQSIEENLGSLISSFQSEDPEERPKKLGRFINSLDDEKKRALVSLGHFFLNLASPETTCSSKATPFSPFSPVEELNILGDHSCDFSSDEGLGPMEVNFFESYELFAL